MRRSIKPSPAGSPVSLRHEGGAPVAFRGAKGAVVECLSGRLWVTIAGQPGDFLLAAGERLHVDSDGLGLVEGLPVGELRLVAAAEARRSWAGIAVSAARNRAKPSFGAG